jgi:hypothetical protein
VAYRPLDLQFIKGGVRVRYNRDGEVTDEVMFTHEAIIKNIAYPELIEYIYENVAQLIANVEEDLLEFQQDDN